MPPEMQKAITFILFSSALGFGVGIWLGYMLIKHALKNALIESGLVVAVNRLADWQPRSEPNNERPEWAK